MRQKLHENCVVHFRIYSLEIFEGVDWGMASSSPRGYALTVSSLYPEMEMGQWVMVTTTDP